MSICSTILGYLGCQTHRETRTTETPFIQRPSSLKFISGESRAKVVVDANAATAGGMFVDASVFSRPSLAVVFSRSMQERAATAQDKEDFGFFKHAPALVVHDDDTLVSRQRIESWGGRVLKEESSSLHIQIRNKTRAACSVCLMTIGFILATNYGS